MIEQGTPVLLGHKRQLSTTPEEMQFTRSGASSTASALAKPSRAVLSYATTDVPGPGRQATRPEKKVIDPAAERRGVARRAAKNGPQNFEASIWVTASVFSSARGP